MSEEDFRDNESKFLPTNNPSSIPHIFDVNGSPTFVVVGNELKVNVIATNTIKENLPIKTSNSVEVVDESTGLGACCFGTNCVPNTTQQFCEINGGDWQGPNTTCTPDPCGEQNLLDFDINLTRVSVENGFNPAFGDFIAGQDTIEAAIQVTNGEIVGVPIVRWYITADHFPKPDRNVWNNGDPPTG